MLEIVFYFIYFQQSAIRGMSFLATHRRHRSYFQKGMSLGQYLRKMDLIDGRLNTNDQNLLYENDSSDLICPDEANNTEDNFIDILGPYTEGNQENKSHGRTKNIDNLIIVSTNLHRPYLKRLNCQASVQKFEPKPYRVVSKKSSSPASREKDKNQNRLGQSPYKNVFKKMRLTPSKNLNESKSKLLLPNLDFATGNSSVKGRKCERMDLKLQLLDFNDNRRPFFNGKDEKNVGRSPTKLPLEAKKPRLQKLDTHE